MNLIKTGIPGLDEILKGGFIKNSSIMIKGPPGMGKTVFGLQFLLEGAKNNEPGMLICCDEEIEDIRAYARSLGLELEQYEKKGLINLIKQPVTTRKLISIAAPINIIQKKKVKRVVLDSLTLFEYIHVAGAIDFRKEVLTFLEAMKNVTLVVTSEGYFNSIDEITYKPEDFLFKGLIILTKIRKASFFERCLHIAKMRGKEHLQNIYPMTIKQGGITVHPKILPFSLVGEPKRFEDVGKS